MKAAYLFDYLRVNEGRLPSEPGVNVSAAEAFFEFAKGILPSKVQLDLFTTNYYNKKRIDTVELYSLLNQKATQESWVNNYNKSCGNQALIGYFKKLLKGYDLVLSYELSPYIISCLEKIDIDYLDLSLSPIRFGRDYFLGLRTNNSKYEERFKQFTIKGKDIKFYASLIKAKARTQNVNWHPVNNSAVFCGQMDVDSSLITKEGTLIGEEQIFEELLKLCINYDKVYYKRHPHLDLSKIPKCISKISKVEVVERNVYAIISHPAIRCVSAVSSSILEEARFFEKETRRLLPSVHEFDYDKNLPIHNNGYFPISSQISNFGFWSYILGYKDDYIEYQYNQNLSPSIGTVLNDKRWG